MKVGEGFLPGGTPRSATCSSRVKIRDVQEYPLTELWFPPVVERHAKDMEDTSIQDGSPNEWNHRRDQWKLVARSMFPSSVNYFSKQSINIKSSPNSTGSLSLDAYVLCNVDNQSQFCCRNETFKLEYVLDMHFNLSQSNNGSFSSESIATNPLTNADVLPQII
ncbi:hypothetical protein GmHk_18G053489 [Glycine max]|nr:hypothetical protein GmHk_18G053489 [Glycine max]